MNAQELLEYLNELKQQGIDLEVVKVTARVADEAKQKVSLHEVEDIDHNSVDVWLSITI